MDRIKLSATPPFAPQQSRAKSSNSWFIDFLQLIAYPDTGAPLHRVIRSKRAIITVFFAQDLKVFVSFT